jgi:hypothetical protein
MILYMYQHIVVQHTMWVQRHEYVSTVSPVTVTKARVMAHSSALVPTDQFTQPFLFTFSVIYICTMLYMAISAKEL